MTTVAFVYATITLTMPLIPWASNVVSSNLCKRISCSTSDQCPPWNYCDTHYGFCEPCNRCLDGSDAKRPVKNCLDPTLCINSLFSDQDYGCPRLQVADGFSCSVECSPCGGTFGSYLGTTCRGDCADGDWEVFSCIFLNEIAQWNITRKPDWITYEAVYTPPAPPFPTATSIPPQPPPPPPPAAYEHYHLEALVGIVAGTVMGVTAIVFSAIILVVCVRREGKRRDVKRREEILQEIEEHEEPDQQIEEQTSVSTQPENMVQPAKSTKIPVEDPATSTGFRREPVELGSSGVTSSQISLQDHRHPVQMSDYDYSSYHTYDHPSRRFQPTVQLENSLKNHQAGLSQSSLRSSVVSLHSDRTSTPQPPEELLPLLFNPLPVGSSDSGNPPGRLSSSSSLPQETLRKSVLDERRDYRPEPTEQETQETSSGFHRNSSYQNMNTGFSV